MRSERSWQLSDEELLKILDDHDWASVPMPTRRRLLPGIKRAMRSASIVEILWLIEDREKVQDYENRNRLVYCLLTLAIREGWECGVRIDINEPEWPVVFIDLPTGQISWHVPQYVHAWDGHDTEEKYRRCREYAGCGNR